MTQGKWAGVVLAVVLGLGFAADAAAEQKGLTCKSSISSGADGMEIIETECSCILGLELITSGPEAGSCKQPAGPPDKGPGHGGWPGAGGVGGGGSGGPTKPPPCKTKECCVQKCTQTQATCEDNAEEVRDECTGGMMRAAAQSCLEGEQAHPLLGPPNNLMDCRIVTGKVCGPNPITFQTGCGFKKIPRCEKVADALCVMAWLNPTTLSYDQSSGWTATIETSGGINLEVIQIGNTVGSGHEGSETNGTTYTTGNMIGTCNTQREAAVAQCAQAKVTCKSKCGN